MAAHPLPPAAPPPNSRRDVVYRVLCEGPTTQRRLAEEYGIPMAIAHVESLKAEGHTIQTLKGTDPVTQLPVTHITMLEDAWRKPFASVEFTPTGDTTAGA